jgi:Domain of unknown function (DUF4160)
MPTVMRVNGYTFRIHTDDHPPPHVHVELSGARCKIAIGEGDEAPSVIKTGTMRRTDAGRAAWTVYECQEMLLAHWRRIHGREADDGGDPGPG